MNEEPPALGEPIGKQKRTNVACIRCRLRHIRCPGGDPCKKCSLARAKCEYVEGEKKIVVLMKYLLRLHDDIARLKKENAGLRHQLQELPQHTTPGAPAKPEPPEVIDPHQGEVITPLLDKHGRMIELRTGEKLYVGSLLMTLFGLEIQNMALESPLALLPLPAPPTASPEARRETAILEMEGNAYKITLEKTNTRPGLLINFTLPLYLYAMLLVDTFINYNDGCFYFFNEGLVKRFLMNLYLGKTRDNHAILKRNAAADDSPDDDTILETIWFCKILLIFAIGEMYLGTESDSHLQAKRDKKDKKSTLPGAGFFYQALELFTGLFALGAIDNITKDGGIEVMLLYAFYLQVADCTVALYFYFGLALRLTLILGWHVDADKENLNRFELEHRRRIWWTVYMYERMLSLKAGLPLLFADDLVSTELPFDFHADPVDDSDVRLCYIFPPADYINNCVTITQINAIILLLLYTKQPTVNILPVVTDLVQRLVNWKVNLPAYLRVDFSADNLRVLRLVVNLMTEYFQGINLAVRPLLFHFATKKLKELQQLHRENRYIDLTKFSKNVLLLLNLSFQASINTIKLIWALVPENMVALFGWMDREYLFTLALTLILFNASFGVHEATKEHLDHALIIFTKMKKLGNYPAALRRAQLLKLIKVLDFNGNTQDLIQKHDDVSEAPAPVPAEFDVFKPDVDDVPMIDMPPSYALDLAGIEGVTFPDEESRLWNEITNDALWLNVADADLASQLLSQQHPTNSRSFSGFLPAAFGYSDIINLEFHDIM